MRLKEKFGWIVLSGAALFLLSLGATSARAEKAPDPAANQMMADFLKQGAKVFYLGKTVGMDGWLVVKDGKTQIAYVPAGSQYLIVGLVFQPGGKNLTLDQIQQAAKDHPEILTMLGQNDVLALPPPNAAAGAAAGSGAPLAATAPVQHPGEILMKQLLGASGVTVGSASAPQLIMVMDPDCRHCRATWGLLRDAVMKKTLQIRMVPIGTQDSNSERAAAQFLKVADPLNAWDKYVGGDNSQLAGTPSQDQIAAVRANHELIDSWQIDVTPFLAYRSKSGEIKIIKGELQQPASVILNDIAPTP